MAKKDYLKDLSIQEISAWFNRAADLALTEKVEGQNPMAGVFLKRYLTNRDPNYVLTMEAPAYLKKLPKSKIYYSLSSQGLFNARKGQSW